MIRPMLYSIDAFDAMEENTISFAWKGEQAFGNRLIVKNNTTNQTVYEKDNTTMKLQHTLPPESLTNGICYAATLYVLNSNGEIISDISNSVVFYCYSKPIFKISGLKENDTIKNSSYQAVLEYEQGEGEPLCEYTISLYSTSKNVYQTSGIRYDSAQSFTFHGMLDNNSYYARATGKTVNGMSLDTGYILFHVEYVRPNIYAILNLENVYKKGYVKFQSNIVAIKGKSNPDPPEFIDDDLIDLRNKDTWVKFDEFFDLTEDYSLAIIGRGRTANPFQMTDGNAVVNLYYREGCYKSQNGELKGFFELRVPNPMSEAIYVSDYINPLTDNDYWQVWIKKVNSVFQVYAEILENYKIKEV